MNRNQYSPIAIVGFECRLPGAVNTEAYWDLLLRGGDASAVLSPEMLDRELYFDSKKSVRGKSYSDVAALEPRLPPDLAKCRLSEEQAARFDRCHLTMCEVAHNAMQHAGYTSQTLTTRRAGVYFGHTGGTEIAGDLVYCMYAERAAAYLASLPALAHLDASTIDQIASEVVSDVRQEHDHLRHVKELELSASMGARLIAKAFELEGPAVVIDAACASSMQAVAIASRALRQGSIDMAIVGGASCYKTDSMVLFSQAQSVSPEKSRPFDADADGLITAEGHVALVLKTLDRAVTDGDNICAVIRGVGVASDGRGKSLWAPLKTGQSLAVQRAYPDGLTPGDVQFIEAHATSTQVGDATEVSALGDAFTKYRSDGKKIFVGSVKGNVGHTLESAGVAGIAKVLLAMQHGVIPPQANLNQLNPSIPWDELPFEIPKEPQAWLLPDGASTRVAAVNSFGIGGLNVHVLLEQYDPALPLSHYGADADTDASADKNTSATNTDYANEPIAVIGRGAILPNALDSNAVSELLINGARAICEVPKQRWSKSMFMTGGPAQRFRTRSSRGGFVTGYQYDWRRHKVPPKQVANANPLQFMLLDAAEQCLVQAGYDPKTMDRDRVGVIVGTAFGGDFSNELQMGLRIPEFCRTLNQRLASRNILGTATEQVNEQIEGLILDEMPALLDETGSFTSSTLASRLTKTFDLRGGAMSLDAGPGSGAAALSACVDTLRGGECDLMFCAAGQRTLDMCLFEALDRRKQLAIDDAAEGQRWSPGEGAAVLLLKRLSDARRDGDEVLATIQNVSYESNRSTRSGSANTNQIPRFADGDLERTIVDCSQPKQESLGPWPAANEDVSLTRQLGFTGAPHPLIGIIRETLRGSEPSTAVIRAGEASDGYYRIELGDQSSLRNETSAPTSLAAGSIAQSLSSSPTQLARFGAASSDNLLEQLRSFGAPTDRFTSSDRVRLVIVCSDNEQLNAKRTLAADLIQRDLALSPITVQQLQNEGILYGMPRPGGIGMFFPGQGCQYPAMLSQLVTECPFAGRAYRTADSALSMLGHQSFDDLLHLSTSSGGDDIWATQASILVAQYLLIESLRGHGVQPSIVAGHSFGEYAALLSAGAWGLSDALLCARQRANAIDDANARGAMAAVSLNADGTQSQIDQSRADVYIANINSPDQTVVGGTRSQVENLLRHLKAQKVPSVQLKVGSPFHTPLMIAAQQTMQSYSELVAMSDSRLPVVLTSNSSVTCCQHDFRRSLHSQLTSPVDFLSITDQVLASQPAMVIDVGPKQSLLRLIQSSKRQNIVPIVAADTSKNRGLRGIMAVVALSEIFADDNVDAPLQRSAVAVATSPTHLKEFDATTRRRERMRRQSSGTGSISKTQFAKTPSANPHPKVAASNKPAGFGSAENRTAGGRSPQSPFENAAFRGTSPSADSGSATVPRVSISPASPVPVPSRLASESSYATDSSRPASADSNGAVSKEPNAASIERMLIDFVVEQTGYPDEMVELNADLEADLGIDSIKKAQLFGELGEQLSIAPRADLSLDDFTTLAHVRDFLLTETSGTETSPPTTEPMAPAAGYGEQSFQNSEIEANTFDSSFSSNGDSDSPSHSRADSSNIGTEGAAIERLLIDFVVEQTGYPEEMVEMEADLEADLGIDSIKKAQLFGELGEQLSIAPRADLSLDDFTTLAHVREFLLTETVGTEASSPVGSIAIAPMTPAVKEFSSNGQHDLPSHSQPAVTGGDVEGSKIERLLIDFVVEQTGYPEDMVELEADLEADLGIDSIKKAQLFGELGEQLGIAPRADLSLDDFTTLSHVRDFLIGNSTSKSLETNERISNDHTTSVPEPIEVLNDTKPPKFVAHVGITRWDYEGGQQYANALRDELRANAQTQLNSPTQTVPPKMNSFDEGIAATAHLPVSLVTKVLNAPRIVPSEVFGGATAACCIGRESVVVHAVRPSGSRHHFMSIGYAGSPLGLCGVNQYGLAIQWQNSDSEIGAGLNEIPFALFADCKTIADARQQLAILDLNSRWTVLATQWKGDGFMPPECIHGNTADMQAAIGFVPRLVATGQVQLIDPVTGVTHDVDWRAASDASLPTAVTAASLPSVVTESPLDNAVMQRHVLDCVPATARDAAPMLVDLQPVVIVGNTSVATSLVAALNSLQIKTEHWPLDESLPNRLASQRPQACQGVLFAGDDSADMDSILHAAEISILACQALLGTFQPGQECWIAATTRLGGDFGFSGVSGSPAGGATTGLFKALRREFPSLRAKVIDFDPETAAHEVAMHVVDELRNGDSQLEVGYQGRQRHIVAARVAAVDAESPACETVRKTDGAWIVSGGGRGVTAEVALALGRTTGGTMHLVGTTATSGTDAPWRALDAAQLKQLKRESAIKDRQLGQTPGSTWRSYEKQMELDQNLKRFAAAGVQAQYHVCDVANQDAVDRLVQAIRQGPKPVVGVVHGAGIESACRLSAKKPEWVRMTLTSKCKGAETLIRATAQDPLAYFVSFGSTSGRFGGLGQSDYSMASDLLAKRMGQLRRQRPELRSVCFHWPAWGDVGMAARPESRMALQASGLTFMPAAEGAAHVVRELLANDSAHEVLLLDQPGMLDTDGTMTQNRNTVTEPTPASAGLSTPIATVQPVKPSLESSSVAGILGAIEQVDHDTWHIPVRLDPEQDPFLASHLFQGNPMLPGVVTLDLFCRAGVALFPHKHIAAIEDVRLDRGVQFPKSPPNRTQPSGLTLRVSKQSGTLKAELVDLPTSGATPTLFASAKLRLADSWPQLCTVDVGTPIYGWTPFTYPDQGMTPMWHGEPLRTFTFLDFQHGGGRAKLLSAASVPLYQITDADGQMLPAAALDGVFVACGCYSFAMLEGRIGLPAAIERLTVARLPDKDEKCELRFFYRGTNETGDLFDCVLMGEGQRPILELVGYQTKVV